MALRIILAAVALLLALNGLNMLFDPAGWYASVPSVPHTGPLNPHFVRDIGIAYLTSSLSVGLAAWRGAYFWPGLITALAFLGLHALLHIWEAIIGLPASMHMSTVDLVGVYGPAVILLAIVGWVRLQPGTKET